MSDIEWLFNVDSNIFHSENDIQGENAAESAANLPSYFLPSPTWIEQRQADTAKLKNKSWKKMLLKVTAVLHYMEKQEINLPLFLHALSWGHKECRDIPLVAYARAQLLTSEELPVILENWWMPPKSRQNTARPRGAKEVFEKIAQRCIEGKVNEEMEAVPVFLRSKDSKLSAGELQNISYCKISSNMISSLPSLWQILRTAACGLKTTSRSSKRDPERVIMTAISMLAYTRRHSYNLLQKMFAVYFKHHGLSARAFDTIHSLGLTMSMKWTTDCIGDLAAASLQEMLALRDNSFWLMTHDNLNIAFQVYSQRLNNQTHFDSGTAATVYIKPNTPKISSSLPELLRKHRAKGLTNPITPKDLIILEMKATRLRRPFLVHEILKILLRAPEFNLKEYEHRDSTFLKPPQALQKLAYGPDHPVRQFVLGTVKIEEASYEGNNSLLKEWMQQLKLDSHQEKQKTAQERLLYFGGDLLTVERMLGLFRMRAGDYNSYDRLDFLVPISGWLHIMMAYANSLHNQYLGTAAGRGLNHAVVLLKRKGLLKVLTKGPFYHDVKELLFHVMEAHIRVCWIHHIGGKDLSSLRSKTPIELLTMADEILDAFASTKAMERIYPGDKEKPYDEVMHHATMMSRDLLHYSMLEFAIKNGDVGMIRNMLTHLLFRFHGGSNPKYAIEMMNLIQGFEREWPEEVIGHVLEHCWLINFRGKEDSFHPLDMAQEHNIRDIKDTYRPDGPNSNWEYLKKISPAIPAIKAVAAHVEEESGVLSRGKKHKDPDPMKDILLLQRSYEESYIHVETVERKIRESEKTIDIYSSGAVEIQNYKHVNKWHEGRNFKRETCEIWEEKNAEFFRLFDDVEGGDVPMPDAVN